MRQQNKKKQERTRLLFFVRKNVVDIHSFWVMDDVVAVWVRILYAFVYIQDEHPKCTLHNREKKNS